MRPRITSVGLIMPPRPAKDFIYPSHIDHGSLADLPSKPGVYAFRDQSNRPVYIGKSVNLRARVMSHLRAAEEAAMLAATMRVDFIRTAGEIGALLLESQLIKRFQPAFNVLLKFAGESFGLELNENTGRVCVVAYEDSGAADTRVFHGLFGSRSEADQAWRALVRQHQLCPALLGMEATTHGRACFSHQLGRCRGACIGIESAETHQQRLRMALGQLDGAVWPYGGPIGIVEADGPWRQMHVIDRWSFAGSLDGSQRRLTLPAFPRIDMDTYKILAAPLAQGRLAYVHCEVNPGRAGIRTCQIPACTALGR